MRKSGFTLIELLIVIAIIAILAAVLIPNLLNARKAAAITSTLVYVRNTLVSLEVLKAATGSFPAGITNGMKCDTIPGNNPLPKMVQPNSCVVTIPSASSPDEPSSYDVQAKSVYGITIKYDGTRNTVQ